MSLRRLIPDCSALIPAFFPEMLVEASGEFDLSPRAKPLLYAIRTRTVQVFAPELLAAEFLKVTQEKTYGRSVSERVDANVAEAQWLDFLTLPIVYIPAAVLAPIASDLVFRDGASPPDSWYLAAAIHANAELWMSHEHRDGAAEIARRRIGDDRVKSLRDDRFA